MTNWLLRMLIVLMCCAASAVMAAQQIDSVRMSKSPDATRIVFDLQAPLQHTVNKLGNPDRIVVDLDGAALNFDFSKLDLRNSPIREIRTGQHAADKVRVVLDLTSAQRPKTSMLAPSEGSGWRLVIDLLADLDPEDPPNQVATISKSPLGETLADFRPMVVALDPGHGGQDPGAIGPSGTREKDIVLQIGKRLADHINRQPGMRAVLVRTGDYYVPLADRRRIAADKYNADVFLSIHADAFTDSRAHGASVFALSHHGSTSARAGYLARIANDSDKVAGVYKEERENNSLLNVIADLTTSGSLTHSLVLGRMILEEMGQVTKLHGDRRKVEQAGFAVLKEPSMVSLLVETGFISNRTEEKNLRSSAHQEKMAKAIVGGLHKYFEMHPKPETYYALLRSRGGVRPATHKINSGETISSIARRYDISENSLREHNKLRGDKIRAGQVLRIPPG
ncbi:N-acetylmuramoyl-L-alanine amidase [Alcanivorax sp. 1008]|uniref:N-acetylmuramoyl-L-alanine amidase n=1 Tax=Alcanivorax sp. 1008 TaxID=2816853 RepID=UPI001D60BE85|nr:N-acetylmuramoyl-L-alanine amidase [Alcanivorax sp. 1008]MCC1496978.1 N-acetylmuramoyl-L-alanine amidase [Alcanivorax sp. 1008]